MKTFRERLDAGEELDPSLETQVNRHLRMPNPDPGEEDLSMDWDEPDALELEKYDREMDEILKRRYVRNAEGD